LSLRRQKKHITRITEFHNFQTYSEQKAGFRKGVMHSKSHMKLVELACSPIKGAWLEGVLFVLLEHFAGEIIIQSAELEFI
jgi:hypothetical protein